MLAYIDPTSGAILLQVVIAGIIGCGAFFWRSFWQVGRRLFRRKRSADDPPQGP